MGPTAFLADPWASRGSFLPDSGFPSPSGRESPHWGDWLLRAPRPAPRPLPSRPCARCAWPPRRWLRTSLPSGSGSTRRHPCCCRTGHRPCTRCTTRWNRTWRCGTLHLTCLSILCPPTTLTLSLTLPSPPAPPPAAGGHGHRGQTAGRRPRHHQVSPERQHQGVGAHRGQARCGPAVRRWGVGVSVLSVPPRTLWG